MRKIVIFVSLLLASRPMFGNPVPEPHAIISEFKFDPVDKWQLEIGFGSIAIGRIFTHSHYDSVYISTSSGTARVRLDFVRDSVTLLVITPDSLSVPLSVNHGGDCITLYSFLSQGVYHMEAEDAISFGDYPYSECDSTPNGYSICRFETYRGTDAGLQCCLSKRPTIGTVNDTSGCCATIMGTMFDKNGKKITAGEFILDYPVAFHDDSTYTMRVYACKYNLSYLTETISGINQYAWMDTINVDAYPDSIIRKDIHFTNVDGMKTTPVPSNPDLYIINYPNPFNPTTNFFIRIPGNLKRKEGHIDIYNSIGQKVFVVQL
jgi:hypothetical protein